MCAECRSACVYVRETVCGECGSVCVCEKVCVCKRESVWLFGGEIVCFCCCSICFMVWSWPPVILLLKDTLNKKSTDVRFFCRPCKTFIKCAKKLALKFAQNESMKSFMQLWISVCQFLLSCPCPICLYFYLCSQYWFFILVFVSFNSFFLSYVKNSHHINQWWI
jgi:hypothetical protein